MLFDWDGSRIRFTTYADSSKLHAIRQQPHISVLVESGSDRRNHRGVSLEGIAELTLDPIRAQVARAEISKRYAADFLAEFASDVEQWWDRNHVLIQVIPDFIRSWDFSKLARP
jgi:hypothetical protein